MCVHDRVETELPLRGLIKVLFLLLLLLLLLVETEATQVHMSIFRNIVGGKTTHNYTWCCQILSQGEATPPFRPHLKLGSLFVSSWKNTSGRLNPKSKKLVLLVRGDSHSGILPVRPYVRV